MNVYLYILVMAAVTYLIRALPLILVKGKIENPFIKSFLYYVPYACLMAMTFPSVLHSTASVQAAAAGVIAAFILSIRGHSLMTVALAACVTSFLVSVVF